MGDFNNKQPIELTDEETYELVKQIADIEYSRDASAKLYQDSEDGAIEILTYALEKDKRGKKGLNSYYKHLSMKHFKNLMHFEIRNNLSYNFRKISVQKTVLEVDSLDRKAFVNNENETLGDTIIDERHLNQMEEDLEINTILSKIDNTDNDNIYMKIKYGTEEEQIHPLNYRNLTKYYYDFSDNKKLNTNSFKGVLFDSSNDKALEDDEIKEVIKDYKRYMTQNNILGGATI